MNAIIICPCCRHWVLASLLDSLAAAPAPPTDPVKSEFPKQNSQKNSQNRHRQRSAPPRARETAERALTRPIRSKSNSQKRIPKQKSAAPPGQSSGRIRPAARHRRFLFGLIAGGGARGNAKEMVNAEVEYYRQRASAGSTRHHQLTTYYQPPAFQRAAIVRTRSPAACRRRGAIR